MIQGERKSNTAWMATGQAQSAGRDGSCVFTINHMRDDRSSYLRARLAGILQDADTAGNRDIRPGRTEVPHDTIDNNCTGLTDEPGFIYCQDIPLLTPDIENHV